MHQLSIVIPAYNEEKKISKDIEAVYEYFKSNSIDGELVVVDDGSRDKTVEIANNYKNKFSTLKIITYEKNRGKGYAVKIGILEATGSYILISDSGLCVPYRCTNTGIELLKGGCDIALGSRKTKDNKSRIVVPQPLYRRLGSRFFKFLLVAFNIIPKGIEDTQCGFKLYKKDVAHDIFGKMFTEKFMWDIEMLGIANKKRYKIATFPVDRSNDPDTRYNPIVGSFENLLQIIKIVLRT